MNKTEIIKSLHSSQRHIEQHLTDEELSYIHEELPAEKISPIEFVVKQIESPGLKYHDALKIATDYCIRYQEIITKLKIRFKREGHI
jgi:hypothetical protein